MNILKKLFASTILVCGFGASVAAHAVDEHSTPAVQGYDVVSYQAAKRPVRGNGNFIANFEGAVYQFSSKENQSTFEKNPEKYVPAYNGYCAFGVSVGKKFIGDPEVWRVVDGQLYLNLDAGIQDLWFKDIPGNINKADKKWRSIENKRASAL